MQKTLLLFSLFLSLGVFSQRGKNGALTITALNTQVNAYTALTANATLGSTSISVTSNVLTSATLTSPLTQGDLIMIIQMQGATMDIDLGLIAMGFDWTTPAGHNYDWPGFRPLWGQLTAYNNAGKYELIEVQSIAGSTTINLQCGLKNAYTASGHVQIVRVPRLTTLTLNASTSIVPPNWNGTTGGIVALEVDGNVTLNANSRITATGFGFRGGVTNTLPTGGSPPGSVSDRGFPGSPNPVYGAQKGEGIGGYHTEYDALSSRYCNGAPANGGGGANNHNSGGGGGANVGTGTYTGEGNPTAGFVATWNTESAGFATSSSSGGGRGGYSYSTSNQNATTQGPQTTPWSGDYRRNEGGLGGHPLLYDPTRIFAGGGGGSGHQNGTQAGSGGRGGGIVYMTVYGSISGTGTVEVNGANGVNANPTNAVAATSSSQKFGNDGAGGAGGGGAIVISNGTAIATTIALNANGGVGGNQVISYGSFAGAPTMEGDGPGGGGAGGMIALTSGTPTQTVTGGVNGVTNSTHLTEFPPNGATIGANGIANLVQPFFNLTVSNVSICTGNTATLTATIQGTLPAGATVLWYSTQFGGSSIGSGTTFTTPVLTTTTTYYVGTCPGTFRLPVIVTVGGPTISGVAVVTNANCSSGGSITGLTTSGGVAPVVITWNGVVTPTMNLSNASAGTYNVVVTDNVGCTATSGPYTITSTSGPTINSSAMTVTPASCLGNDGSITGITATGSGITFAWSNGATTLNINSLPAGSYSLVVTDNVGCTANLGPITINSTAGPTSSSASVVVANATCGNNNGSITGITATGTALTYTWNGVSSPSIDINSLVAGTYTFVATDGSGCSTTQGPFTITNSTNPTISTAGIVLQNEHCNMMNGSITGITVSGGTTPYSYSWNGGTFTTLNITGLAAGSFSLVVSDANGCTTSAGPFTITNIAGPTINTTGIAITPESCAGNDGAITGITTTGSGLTFQWNFTTTPTVNLTGAVAGTYGLLVTDGFGCTATAGPFTIGSTPGPTSSSAGVVITNATCGNTNGSIMGITTTGTALTYTWNGVASPTIDISGLAAGSYTFIATNASGCTTTQGPFTITSTSAPTISTTAMVVQNEHCNMGDGSITGITVSGGTTPYSYSWNGGTFTTLDIISLSAGSYSLVVSDANGCSASAGPFTISNIAGPTINTAGIVITPESCAGNDGSISGITTTGSGLTFQWNSITTPTVNLSNTAAGTYNLVVADGFGCSATAGPFTIGGSTPMNLDSINLVITPTGCGNSVGSIMGLQVIGGINPVVSWNNSATTLDISNLSVGIYTITVSDDQSCSIVANFSVSTTNGPAITSIVSTDGTCGSANGSIVVSASGGTNPLGFSIDNGITFQATGTFNGLSANTYSIVVQDATGCNATASSTINPTTSPSISSAPTTSPSCGNADGSITINASGGNGALQYSIDGGITFVASSIFTNLSSGSYSIIVNDASSCSANQTVVLNDLNGPTVVAGSDRTVCAGENVTLSATGAATYVWDNGAVQDVSFIPPATTTYTVTGTDANGCSASDQVIITVESSSTINIQASVTSGCAPVVVTFTNTTPNTVSCNWQFSSGQSSTSCGNQTITFSVAGCYDLQFDAVSPAGCPMSQTFNDIVCVTAPPIASFIASPNTLTADNAVSNMINNSSGATTYSWSFGDGSSSSVTSPTHTFSSAGGSSYVVTLTATNALGCSDEAQATIFIEEDVVFYVPNAFTPDGDEFNQLFNPVFTSGFDQYDFNMQIINRWGEVIFETNDAKIGWDGTYQGLLVQQGVYTYRIEFKTLQNDERRRVHGHVMVLR